MKKLNIEISDGQFACCQAFIELPVHLVYEYDQDLKVNVPRRRWPTVEALFAEKVRETMDVVLAACPLQSAQAKLDQIEALRAEVQEMNKAGKVAIA